MENNTNKNITPLMAGKRGLVMGVANNRSIAWGIAKTLHHHGAEIAFTYQGEAIEKRIKPLAKELDSDIVIECDVSEKDSIISAFETLRNKWEKIDFIVHAIAFSDKNELTGRYIDTSQENFLQTMLISTYSLTAVSQVAEKMLNENGSILTLTYYGAEKVMPHYNIMGVAKAGLEASVRYLSVDLGKTGKRINAISAGPIKTLAASGIGDFRYILKWNEYNSPLRRTVSTDDVGNAATYLLSDLSSSVTGEIHHVDAGYHVVGMKNEEAPDITTTNKE
ncbi:enoyl-ACP reductase FabI [Hyphomicrobiales bacterium]|jgi:enoyl-[acyl-carrier protein] reductase I|nr:enoyl-ACP reductase FabI [Hyphomicrobiales bacterium]MDC3272499.1 enoyl-ACP reductase FabI [Hyphomicrobiales bacterium]|tara:strand:- start:1233 stop:2069 length:837 start_codon:yes stop_codon:yes gene_type:complete